MLQQSTVVEEQARSPMVEGFARFWANPNPAVLPPFTRRSPFWGGSTANTGGASAARGMRPKRALIFTSASSALKSPNTPRTASSTSSAGSGARPEQRVR